MSTVSPCNLCSPPHKAHILITSQMECNSAGQGQLGVNNDENQQLSLSISAVFLTTSKEERFLFYCCPWTKSCGNTYKTTQWTKAIYVHEQQRHSPTASHHISVSLEAHKHVTCSISVRHSVNESRWQHHHWFFPFLEAAHQKSRERDTFSLPSLLVKPLVFGKLFLTLWACKHRSTF